MCLILLAWQMHPDYPLVVAANRDEFFARPTAAADFWHDAPQILAGRDLEAGGSWMGISRSGRFAALTNYRDPARQRPDAPSRGQLVADFLGSSLSPMAYLDQIDREQRPYNGYNLLVGDGATLCWASNVADERRQLLPGLYGVSNHLLDTPWPKVGAGKTALGQALAHLPQRDALFDLLRDDSRHPDQHLPQTGVSLEWERLLSAAFVRAPDYGTRSSTVLTLERSGWISLEEQTWLAGAQPGGRVRYRFAQQDVRTGAA